MNIKVLCASIQLEERPCKRFGAWKIRNLLSIFVLNEGFWHIFWGQEFYGLNPAQVTWQQRVLGTAMVHVIIVVIIIITIIIIIITVIIIIIIIITIIIIIITVIIIIIIISISIIIIIMESVSVNNE